MYEVEFTPEAEDDLSRLHKPVAQRALKKIRWLAENFEMVTPEPLTGEFKGVYKLRIGDWRILYTFTQSKRKVIIIHLVKHRREVYKF
jgi:mRNA interferase RelE/StbE